MNRHKFPRTRHFPWSRSKGEDDKEHSTTKQFEGEEVVATIKYDGENTSMYPAHFHARSLDSRHHPSRDAVKAIWGSIRHTIPENYRICGENVYAEHSIAYTDLESYFYGFGVWDDRNVAIDWDSTVAFLTERGLTPARELYRGIYDEKVIKALWDESMRDTVEGYVVRVTREIPFKEYRNLVGKYVRPGHVQTDEHWMSQAIVPNKLKG